MKFIKIKDRHINIEQIVSITSDTWFFYIRMSNADEYKLEVNKLNEKKIKEVLSAGLQLSVKRDAKRAD